MKTLLTLLLLIPSLSLAKIDVDSRNLCDLNDYKELCDITVGKYLVGVNSLVDFSFEKGKILFLINAQKGEVLSLRDNPDPNHKAPYDGIYFVYEDVEEIRISVFKDTPPIDLYICNKGNINCVLTDDID